MTNKQKSNPEELELLIPEKAKNQIRENVVDIDINQIFPNKEQPRKEFDMEDLEALAKSIAIHGVIQPIIVRPLAKGYEIISGERRLRASKLMGKETIACIIRDTEDIASAQIAIIENIQRKDLNQIEEAKAYKNLINKYKFKQDQLSKAVGKSRSYIANTLRLLKLDKKVMDMISKELISSGHGKVLLSIDDKTIQVEVANEIVDKNLSVRETEEYIKNLNKEKKIKKEIKSASNIHIKDFEEELILLLGTKVNVKDKNGKGKIEIEYYSLEDLDRIKEILSESK